MSNVVKWIYVASCFLILCDVIISPCHGQRYSGNRNKPKKKPTGGKFVPGRKPTNKPYYPNRSRRPSLGDVLSRNGYTSAPRRPNPNYAGQGGNNNAEEMNRRNFENNRRNNLRINNANNQANNNGDKSVFYPNVGKVTPPLVRSAGEKPPFAPSWTHCVISVQVGVAWVVVKSPNYPSRFHGQAQCSWIATAMEGYRVRLSFKDLNLLPPVGNGCGNQFVEVIDMELQKSQARFCGSDIPGDYVSQGKKLRLDLQADAINQGYRGFLAAFRADREIPGRRETSYFAKGDPAVLYNPLTDSPPVNPGAVPARRPARRPVIRTTQAPKPRGIPGQNIYGAESQPQNPLKKEAEKDSMESSTTHLYIIIAVILVILVVAAAAYVFKRYFYKKFKEWRKKQKGVEQENSPEFAGGEKMEMKNTSGLMNTNNHEQPLPGLMPLPPPPAYPDIRPGMQYMGDYYGQNPNGHMPPHMMGSAPPMTPVMGGRFGYMQRSHSLDDVRGQDWMQHNGEPIYEDDAMSIHSMASIRSSNRHPEHAQLRQQKILERRNSMHRRSNSFSGDIGSTQNLGQGQGMGPGAQSMGMRQNDVYNTLDPRRPSSLYGQQQFYPYSEYTYGSLPPTNGPGMNGLYGSHPMASRPLFTASTSNLATGPVSNFNKQTRNDNSKSMYDLNNIDVTSQEPDMSAQWSQPLGQRHASFASSTGNSMTSSTNPILKKTSNTPNELAFSALRAAKSMNDLTAINTKLNECVSWTLPSQRRKSIVGNYE